MARLKVIDAAGGEWFVWRRWYVWRRWVTMRDVWNAIPGSGSDRYGNSDPISDAITILVLPLALLGLVVSLVDLVAQLVALPFALLSRLVRLTSWPVQVDCGAKHVRTLRVRGFGAAAALRDEQAALVRADAPGSPPLAA